MRIALGNTFTCKPSKSHEFNFFLTQILGNKGKNCYRVNVVYTCSFSEQEQKEIGCNAKTVIKYNIQVPMNIPTEFGAINYAGRKLIKNWVDLSRERYDYKNFIS